MNFKELYDSLGKDGKEALLKQFLQSVTGAKPVPFAFRKTLKLSTLASDEENRRIIADAMNVPVESVPPLNQAETFEKIKTNFSSVNAITKSYKEYLDKNRKLQQTNMPSSAILAVFLLPKVRALKSLLNGKITCIPTLS